MGLRQTAGRALVWTSFGWILTQLIAFASTVVTARLLSPEVFGLVALVLVIVSATQVFTDAGTRAALVQREGDVRDMISTAVVTVPLGGLVASGVVAACSSLIADFYGEPQLTSLALALSGWIFLFSLTIVPDALLQRRFDLRLRRGVLDPLAITVYGVTVVVLALLGHEVWALVAGQYAYVVTLVIGTYWLARVPIRAGRVSVAEWRAIRRYGRHLLRANIIEVMDGQAPMVVLGRVLGPAPVGLWGAAHRLAKMPLAGITQVAATVLFPALSRMQGDPDRLRLRLLESLRMLSLVTIPVCVTLIGLGEPLVVTLFGEKWRGSGEALQVLAVWALGLSLTEAGREVFKAVGRTDLIARNATVETGTFFAGIALLVVTGSVSVVGIAAAHAVGAGAAMAIGAVNLEKAAHTTPRDLWRAVRPSAVGGAAQCVALLAVSTLVVPGFEGWHRVAGRDLGVLAPLGMLALLSLAGALVFMAVAEIAERGSIRALARDVRLIIRPAAAGGSS